MEKIKKVLLGLAVLVFVSMLAVGVKGEEKENLVLNSSFEKEEEPNKPAGWWHCDRFGETQTYAKCTHVKDKEIAHSGDYCVMIEGKGMAAWIIKPRMEVKGNTTYEFSAWVKSNGVDGKGYNIEALEFVEGKHTKTRNSERSNAPSDWQKVTITFTTIPTITKLELRLYCIGVGNVWFDDISLVEVKETIKGEIKKTAKGESKKISMISENFEDETIAVDRFNLNRSDWKVSDGVLKTKDSVSRMVTFTIGAENRCDYETEFKVKRLELNPKDQHFGIKLEGEEYFLQIYCRGEQIAFREKIGDKFTRHTETFGKLPELMGVGEKAKWSHFKIIFKSNEVKVYVDNVLVSTIEAVLPQKKRVTFYAFHLNLLLDDLMVIPSDSK